MRTSPLVLIGSTWLAVSSLSTGLPERATAGQTPAATIPASETSKRFVGSWTLARIELIGRDGELLPAPAPPAYGSPNPVGLMICDAAGHFGITIMQSGRQKFAGVRPSPEEARSALAGYEAYFGTYTVAADRIVTYHVQGSLNPNETDSTQTRPFEFSGNQLIVAAADRTGRRSRLVWERAPDLPTLTSTHRHFIGFWRRVASERRTLGGQLVGSDQARTIGFLIFSASGHMAVHGMQPGRKRFAGPDPTPEEAQAALETYGSAYFGPYTVYESERLEVTHQIGVINPGLVGMHARRHYELVGTDRLILKPPPETLNGQQVQAFITWERVTAALADLR